MDKTFSLTRLYQLIILALAILLFWKWNCGSPCPAITETIVRDTTYITKHDSSGWVKPQPVKQTPGKPVTQIPVKLPDGRIDTLYQPVDTAQILALYHVIRDYDTTYTFANGKVRVQETVWMNEIQKQRILPTFETQVITNTVTQSEKKRAQVYLGIDGYGGPAQILQGGGLSLMYKSKRDRIYQGGAVLLADQKIIYTAGVKFLLSFRK